MRNVAHRTEAIAESNGMENWASLARRRKWQFAGALARQIDGRWSQKLAEWWPAQGQRSQGRPKTRWADSIEKFAGGYWMSIARDEAQWKAYVEAYIDFER